MLVKDGRKMDKALGHREQPLCNRTTRRYFMRADQWLFSQLLFLCSLGSQGMVRTKEQA